MKYETATIMLAFSLAMAAPVPEAKNKFTLPTYRIKGREVPQEHSHNRFLNGVRTNLNLNNPSKIVDPVFGLLGNAAAAAGAGSITNLDCLHQATADQAFTNAKAAGNVTGMVDALSYAALERNTAGVGVASVICNETAVNPEIQAVQQHQDPASTGAAATNKAVVLALAQQIKAVGGNPQDALLTGTFAAGSKSDTTGKGNTCDVTDDEVGCIFTQNLLVDDATADEIDAAVSGTASSPTSAAGAAADASTPTAAAGAASDASSPTAAASACAPASVVTGTTTVDAPAATGDSNAAAAAASPSATAASSASTSALDFGSCSDPAILFENGLDGRTQEAFIAANQNDFPHGSALGIAVISSFICQQLNDKCKASAAALTACTAGQTAAAAATGQAAADAFNSALGVSGASASTAASATPTASAAAVATPAATAATAATAAAASTASTAATTSDNVQTFTGALGGLPPAVVQSTGARPFSVNGDTFVNKAAAEQRSCSVQHNACADAANAGGVSFSVSDCETQETACNAAST